MLNRVARGLAGKAVSSYRWLSTGSWVTLPSGAGVSNLNKALSANSDVEKAFSGLRKVLYEQDSALTREEKELISVVVSHVNGCQYCLKAHKDEYLKRQPKDADIVLPALTSTSESFAEITKQGLLSTKQMLMLQYAHTLTRFPNKVAMLARLVKTMQQKDVTDAELVEVAQVVSFVNYENRLALGLGVTGHGEDFDLE